MTRKLNYLCVALAATLFIFASGQTASAARYLEYQVLINKHLVMIASYNDKGDKDADWIWRQLKTRDLRPVGRFKRANKGELAPIVDYEVTPDADNPLQATLKGKILIRSFHGGKVTVNRLKLVREEEDGKWRIAPEEVDRTFKLRTMPDDKPAVRSAGKSTRKPTGKPTKNPPKA